MYADYEYYEKEYLLGKEPVIVECDYLYYEKQARAEVDKITFNRCRGLDKIPEEVKGIWFHHIDHMALFYGYGRPEYAGYESWTGIHGLD